MLSTIKKILLGKKKELKDGWWNYRFLVRPIYSENQTVDSYYKMIEVYYNKYGNITMYNDKAIDICIESKKDLKTFIEQIKNAGDRTLLIIDENGKLKDTHITIGTLDMGDEEAWKKIK